LNVKYGSIVSNNTIDAAMAVVLRFYNNMLRNSLMIYFRPSLSRKELKEVTNSNNS
jgi:hypothetical protein